MSHRPRHLDHHRARRNLRRQFQRAMASVARDPNADLWVGYWCGSRNLRRQFRRAMASVARDPNADLWVGYWCGHDDLLLEYAKAGVADTIRDHLSSHPNTKRETLNHALLFAEGEWRDRGDDRHHYVATMEVLLAAGVDASVLPADMVDVLPTLQALALDTELPASVADARTGSRL